LANGTENSTVTGVPKKKNLGLFSFEPKILIF